MTKGQFIKQAETICRQRLKERDDAFAAAAASSENLSTASRGQIEQFLRKVVFVPFGRLITEFSELEPPAKDRETKAAILQAWKAGLKLGETDPAKVVRGDPFLKGNKAAVAYGIKSCNL